MAVQKARLRALAGESVAHTINSQSRLYLQIKLLERFIAGTILQAMDSTKGRKFSSSEEISSFEPYIILRLFEGV